MIMTMLLNRIYRVVFNRTIDGEFDESFRSHVATPTQWHSVLERLAEKQRNWPHRNYRLQMWDEDTCTWVTFADSAANSKYALFSED